MPITGQVVQRVQHFCTLKNRYDLTSCQSRLHETFVLHKKIRIRFDFLRFRIRSMHFDRKGWRIRKNACESVLSIVITDRPAVLMATCALVMAEEHSSSCVLIWSSLSCWAFSLWLLMSTMSVCSLFTSASTFPALVDAASKSA